MGKTKTKALYYCRTARPPRTRHCQTKCTLNQPKRKTPRAANPIMRSCQDFATPEVETCPSKIRICTYISFKTRTQICSRSFVCSEPTIHAAVPERYSRWLSLTMSSVFIANWACHCRRHNHSAHNTNSKKTKAKPIYSSGALWGCRLRKTRYKDRNAIVRWYKSNI